MRWYFGRLSFELWDRYTPLALSLSQQIPLWLLSRGKAPEWQLSHPPTREVLALKKRQKAEEFTETLGQHLEEQRQRRVNDFWRAGARQPSKNYHPIWNPLMENTACKTPTVWSTSHFLLSEGGEQPWTLGESDLSSPPGYGYFFCLIFNNFRDPVWSLDINWISGYQLDIRISTHPSAESTNRNAHVENYIQWEWQLNLCILNVKELVWERPQATTT